MFKIGCLLRAVTGEFQVLCWRLIVNNLFQKTCASFLYKKLASNFDVQETKTLESYSPDGMTITIIYQRCIKQIHFAIDFAIASIVLWYTYASEHIHLYYFTFAINVFNC